MAGSTHIIHKLVLDIQVPQRNAAQKVQDEAVRYFEQVLLKKLEQMLDDMDVPTHVLIDKIDLDLGSGKLEDVFEQLQVQLSKTLEPILNPAVLPGVDEPDDISYSLLTDGQQAFNVFVYFLNSGKLPWYIVPSADWLLQEDVWLDKLSELLHDGSYSLKLVDLFKNSPLALSRLFGQFSLVFIKKLIAVLFRIDTFELQEKLDNAVAEFRILLKDQSAKNSLGSSKSGVAGVIEKLLLIIYLRSGSIEIPDRVMSTAIISLIAQESNSAASISALTLIQTIDKTILLTKGASVLKRDKPIATPDDFFEISKREEIAGIYINQAGLVILHPFLEYFFKDFGLLQDKDFVDLSAKQLAIHLLHYLGTGNINAFEYDLGFEKFLCRWPAEEPLERDIEIPQRMLDEGDNMLRTVIKYWKALKNTSPGGLRESFLMRKGKLIEAEQPARLIVERMDLDILLSSLPWGIGVIKLPWMDEPFYVEWQ